MRSCKKKEHDPAISLWYMLHLDIHVVAAKEQTSVSLRLLEHQASQEGAQHKLGAQFFQLLTAIFIPFNSPKMSFPHSKMVIFLDLETGCCCGDFLLGARALKYNKNCGRQAARTKPSRQVGGFTQKSSIFY